MTDHHDPEGPDAARAVRHTHWHDHGTGTDHDHAHPDGFDGGHSHPHNHVEVSLGEFLQWLYGGTGEAAPGASDTHAPPPKAPPGPK